MTATGSQAGNDWLRPRPARSAARPVRTGRSTARTARGACASGIRSCGRFGPAIDGVTVDRSSSSVRVRGLGGPGRATAPAPWRRPRPGYLRLGAPGEPQVARGSRRRSGRSRRCAPYSGLMLPIVARLASGTAATPGPYTSTNLPTTPTWRSSSAMVSTRSVAVRALGQLAGEPEPDHGRHQHGQRLAEHRGLGLDAAHTPAEHTEPVDHRGVRVGAHQRVGEGRARRRRTPPGPGTRG